MASGIAAYGTVSPLGALALVVPVAQRSGMCYPDWNPGEAALCSVGPWLHPRGVGLLEAPHYQCDAITSSSEPGESVFSAVALRPVVECRPGGGSRSQHRGSRLLLDGALEDAGGLRLLE